MDVVIDTSALIAVVSNAPEKEILVRLTGAASLVAPSSVHWEMGNAFSAMLRRKRMDLESAVLAIGIYASIPIRFVSVDLATSLQVAARYRLYAYDAYLVVCALTMKAPLLTLDRSLGRIAAQAGVDVMEAES